MNNNKAKKSRYHKQSTKSGNEDNNNPEEEELKKYREYIEKLGREFQKSKFKDLSGSVHSESNMENSNNNFSSIVRRTNSRTKEILNDRDFLINFMNDDNLPILPRNMHLLTDDDTNQNIDDKTKYKNLANLLLDDKEGVIESYFVKKNVDKMILKLYTALSRRSKDIFIEENNIGKDKNRILLHIINNIQIPKIKIENKNDVNNNDNINLNNNLKEEKDNLDDNDDLDEDNIILKKILKKKQNINFTKNEMDTININNSNNINTNSILNVVKRNSGGKNPKEYLDKYMKEKPKFNPDCKYNKKNKLIRIIKTPTLETYTPPRFSRYYGRKSRKSNISQPSKSGQWEPDIDCDLLAYINHNIIKIEDIYNKGKENVFELKENQEEEVKPMEAKEVFFDVDQTQNNNEENSDSENNMNKNKSSDRKNPSKKSISNISEDEDTEVKIKNKFCEYKDRLPNLIEISLPVEPDKKKITDFHKELKELYNYRINQIGELAEEMFPYFGIDLKYNKIYKYALNNERNEEISTDSFMLDSTKLSKSEKPELKLNLNLENENEEKNDDNLNKEDSINNKEIMEKKENNNEEEKNESEKSNKNMLYEDDDTNNLYSLQENNENSENNEHLSNNNNDFEENEEDKKSDEDNNNNININNNNEFNEENNNKEEDSLQDHMLKLSLSNNSNN